MELLNNNLIINLSKRNDRWKHVQKEFEKMKIIPNRFEAIEDVNGAIGCTMSHIKCLEIAIENNYDSIFICEDDITFLDEDTLKRNITKFNENVKEWDLLLIGANVYTPYELIHDCCLKVENAQTTTGYVVKKHYYNTLLDNFKNGLCKLKDTRSIRQYSIDIYWKQLQKIHNWYIIYPLTVTQYADHSNITNRHVNYSFLLLNEKKSK